MRIKDHAGHSEELFGIRAEDIHEWIDQYFDHGRYRRMLWFRYSGGWSPYEHRKHLHNKEALPQAIEAFRGKYSEDLIEKVFLQHLKDDYKGYIPVKADFDDPAFLKKYHGGG